jgi:hypothetical protein
VISQHDDFEGGSLLVLRHISKLIVSVKPSGTRKGLSLRVKAGKYIHTSQFFSRRLALSKLKKGSNVVEIIDSAVFGNGRKDYVGRVGQCQNNL